MFGNFLTQTLSKDRLREDGERRAAHRLLHVLEVSKEAKLTLRLLSHLLLDVRRLEDDVSEQGHGQELDLIHVVGAQLVDDILGISSPIPMSAKSAATGWQPAPSPPVWV